MLHQNKTPQRWVHFRLREKAGITCAKTVKAVGYACVEPFSKKLSFNKTKVLGFVSKQKSKQKAEPAAVVLRRPRFLRGSDSQAKTDYLIPGEVAP